MMWLFGHESGKRKKSGVGKETQDFTELNTRCKNVYILVLTYQRA